MTLTIIATGSSFSLAEESGMAKEEKSKFGQHMAVTAFDPEDGFKLSERAVDSLKVKFIRLTQNGQWRIPKSALVYIKNSIGVYRRYQGWIALVLVKKIAFEKDWVVVLSEDLLRGDDVAISGTTFLRMTELDLNADTVDTCSH